MRVNHTKVTRPLNVSVMLRLKALGRPIVEGRGGPLPGAAAQRKPLALLALLAVAQERGLSRDKIVAYLWPEARPEKAAHRLNQLLYALRRDLGSDALFLGSSDLRLNPAVLATDLADFTAALRRGAFEQAVAEYGGPFLDGFYLDGALEFERWVEEERLDLGNRYGSALEAVASEAAERGDLAAAVESRRRLAQIDPLDSRATLRLMQVLHAAGDSAGALQVARVHEALLRKELDASADPAVASFAEQIRSPAARVGNLLTSASHSVDHASIAVLPFANLSADPGNAYFSDGMTEDLINALVKVPRLRVVARSSVFAVKGEGLGARAIGERLQVRTLLEGSVRRVGSHLRITARLIDAASASHLWSEVYDRDVSDVFAVQGELARAIVGALKIRLSENADSQLVQPATQNLHAYTCYLKGRSSAVKRSPDGLRAAVQWFDQAIEADPSYTLAYTGLAEAYHLLCIYGVVLPKDTYPSARLAGQKALALNPNLAESHLAASYSPLCFEWDWMAAESECRRAIELNPSLTQAHHWLAWCLVITGRKAEAAAVARRAMELEPFSPIIHARAGHILAYSGFLEESEAASLRALELDPNSFVALETLATTYSRRAVGRYDEAVDVLTRALEVPGSTAPHFLPWVHALKGDRRAALRCLEALQLDPMIDRVPPTYTSMWVVGAFGALGAKDEAFRWLDRSIADRVFSAPMLGVEEAYDIVRGEPRFAMCLRAVGLVGAARR